MYSGFKDNSDEWDKYKNKIDSLLCFRLKEKISKSDYRQPIIDAIENDLLFIINFLDNDLDYKIENINLLNYLNRSLFEQLLFLSLSSDSSDEIIVDLYLRKIDLCLKQISFFNSFGIFNDRVFKSYSSKILDLSKTLKNFDLQPEVEAELNDVCSKIINKDEQFKKRKIKRGLIKSGRFLIEKASSKKHSKEQLDSVWKLLSEGIHNYSPTSTENKSSESSFFLLIISNTVLSLLAEIYCDISGISE